MNIAVLSDERSREEFLAHEFPATLEVIYADSLRSFTIIEADAYFDLQFQFDRERIQRLGQLVPKPVIINSVVHTCAEVGIPCIRINGWPTMLKRSTAEISFPSTLSRQADKVFREMNWTYRAVPDVPGMIVPRVVSMICNEAAYAVGEEVSTKEEIDTAMKLGTNYPGGPFEWMKTIGPERIVELLQELQRHDSRYSISPELIKEGKG